MYNFSLENPLNIPPHALTAQSSASATPLVSGFSSGSACQPPNCKGWPYGLVAPAGGKQLGGSRTPSDRSHAARDT